VITVEEFPSAQAETLVRSLTTRPDLVVEVMKTITTRAEAAEVLMALGNEVAAWHTATWGPGVPLLAMPWTSSSPFTGDPAVMPLANTALSYTHAADREGVLAAVRTPEMRTIKKAIVLVAQCVRQIRAR
jgi:hypothetical protein